MRVMWTSEMARRCCWIALLTILGAVVLTAIGREAIVAALWIVESQEWAASQVN